MRVWLITVGETVPVDGRDDRPLRTNMLARHLAAAGHEVVWWASTFDHHQKKQLFEADTSIERRPRLRIQLLHSRPYPNNISVQRLVNHRELGRRFRALAGSEPRPDVIVCSLPIPDLCAAATRYGKERSVPVIVDVRDLWPDTFVDLAPRWVRPLARLGLEPLFRSVRASCARATAIVGLTPAFVDWGLEKARRSRTELDRDFPVAYEEQPPAVDAIERAERYWDSLGVARDPNVTRACFFGIIGRSFELEAVVDAARELERRGGDFQFVLCGRGDMLEAYKTQAAGCRGIVFPGWVDAPAIWTLMRRSTVGLAPYRSTRNFVGHIPNKVVEYLSAGLPIVSSLQGSLKLFLEEHGTGVTYPNGDAGALAASLIELRSDPARLLAAARKARSLFEDRFTAGHVLGQMTRHLERVIAAHRGGIDRSVGAASPPARPSS